LASLPSPSLAAHVTATAAPATAVVSATAVVTTDGGPGRTSVETGVGAVKLPARHATGVEPARWPLKLPPPTAPSTGGAPTTTGAAAPPDTGCPFASRSVQATSMVVPAKRLAGALVSIATAAVDGGASGGVATEPHAARTRQTALTTSPPRSSRSGGRCRRT